MRPRASVDNTSSAEIDRRDVFFNVTTPKFAAQAIKKIAEIEWKPAAPFNNVGASVGAYSSRRI